MLKQRLIMGLTLAALFTALLWLDSYASQGWPRARWGTPPGLFLALVTIAVIPFALREMKSLLARENVIISLRVTTIAAILCMLWPWLEQVSESLDSRSLISQWFRSVKPHYLVPTILALSLVAAVAKHSRHQRVDGAMANAGATLLAIVYLGVLPGFYLPICLTHSAWMVLAIVGVVKAADVGAYTTGHLIGRHKLIPWLSPHKTVEGFIGGLVLSALVGAAIAIWLNHIQIAIAGTERWPDVSLLAVLLIGAISGALLGAAGQLGDLLESLLKRDAGVKDSGALPGFGGILDILDSPLLAAPVAYWLLKLVLRQW